MSQTHMCALSSAVRQRLPWTIYTQVIVARFQYHRTYRYSLGAGFGPEARVCKALMWSVVSTTSEHDTLKIPRPYP